MKVRIVTPTRSAGRTEAPQRPSTPGRQSQAEASGATRQAANQSKAQKKAPANTVQTNSTARGRRGGKPKVKKRRRGKKGRHKIRLIYHGRDVTPLPLFPIRRYPKKKKKRKVKTGKASKRKSRVTNKLHKFRPYREVRHFRRNIKRLHVVPDSPFRQNLNYGDEIVIDPEKKSTPVRARSYSPREVHKFVPMATHISVMLSETPTIWLLDVPSITAEKDTEDGFAVEEENERYEYLTVGKGRNRKMVTAEVQTAQILLKTRTTEAETVKYKNNHTFASNWEMYDTYELVFKNKNETVEEFIEDDLDKEKRLAAEALEAIQPDYSMMLLLKSPRFQEAICVIERLLANNNFNLQQKRFRGLLDPDPFREDIEYKYTLNLLWTYSNRSTHKRCVTDMCWNPANPDILAVAYGKFLYTDIATGRILLWNVKNPVQPERTFRFENPVTTISFSKQNPNVLAVGFYHGEIKLIDVSCRQVRVIGISKDAPIYEAIWKVAWFQGSDYFKNEEQIITAGEDGKISHFRPQDTVELLYSQIMRIPRPEGKTKGIGTLRTCHVPGIPVTRYAAALAIQQHPVDANLYYVGTNQGTVHKCSRNYFHQHLEMFLAHDGPVYVLKFSPICNRLFVTCGDDWYARIWVEGIVEPLFDLSNAMASVECADWSPTHSTIVASISGKDICMWDLQRKTYRPQSVTLSPSNSRNTSVLFTPCGRCVVVGDIGGSVHVFALDDMPFPAFFQDDLLISSIIRNLVTRPDLIRRLKKIGKLNFTKSTKQNYFTS